jgi:Zn-dependent M28 family amino/carboxypeptidase
MKYRKILAAGTAMAAALVVPVTASAAVGADSSALRAAVKLGNSTSGVLQHAADLQAIGQVNAARGYRLAGTPGDEATTAYIERTLSAAGYTPVTRHFDFPFFQENSPSQLSVVGGTSYVNGVDFATMQYSGAGDVTGGVVPAGGIQIPPGPTASSSSSGCSPSDFTPASGRQVALIQRGTCTFFDKATNAMAAGYAAVLIFNEGQPDRTDVLNGTLGQPVGIPVLGTSFTVGQQLYNAARAGGVSVHVVTDTTSETRQSHYTTADTGVGRMDRTVLLGAHTDSTQDGPAINDDGSGVALLLELAEQVKQTGQPLRNNVRFGFWGAEESGLLGSAAYASSLSPRQAKDIAVNLAFDMMASDNFVRFVYDGDGSATGINGPNGSGVVEDVFNSFLASQGLPTDPTPLDGRTDYASFTALGIPAGGLFAGAEGVKTAAQQQRYGGRAGQPYYVCYHEACDTYATVTGAAGDPFTPFPADASDPTWRNQGGATTIFDQFADAAADALVQFGQTTSAVNGTDKASDLAKLKAQQLYLGSRLRR